MKRLILAGLVGIGCFSTTAFAKVDNELRDKVNKKISEQIIPGLVERITEKVELKNQRIAQRELELNTDRQAAELEVKIPRIPNLKSAKIKFTELDQEQDKLTGDFKIFFDSSALNSGPKALDFSLNGRWNVYSEETPEGIIYQLNLSVSLGYDFIKASNQIGSKLVENLARVNLDELNDDEKEFLPILEKFAESLKGATDKKELLTSIRDILEKLRSIAITETANAQDGLESAFAELFRSIEVILDGDLSGVQLTQQSILEHFPKYESLFEAYTTKFLVGLYFASQSHKDSEREINLDEGLNFPIKATFAPDSEAAKYYIGETHNLLEGFANDNEDSYEGILDTISDNVDFGLDFLTTTLLSLYEVE